MKILEKKDFTDWRQRCTCDRCESKLEVEPGDVFGYYVEGYGDPRDGSYGESYWYYQATCPVCDNTLRIDAKTMSKAMIHEVQTKRKRK